MMLAAPTTGRRFVSIGVAAALAGCSPQTLRDMEIRGEIPPAARVEGLGRRFYSLDNVEVIRQTREARKSGSSLLPAA